MKIAKTAFVLLILAAGGFLFYQKVYLPKSSYATYTPTVGDTTVEVFGIGQLDARDIYRVGSAVGGKILAVKVEQGSYIHKGDTIATLDPVDLEERLLSAKTSLKRVQTDLTSAKQTLSIAKEQAALAKSTYERDLKIFRTNGISKRVFEKSKTAMLTSKAQVGIAEAKIASTKLRLQEIQSEIKGLQKRLAQMTITAPVDGYIIEKNVLAGQSIPPAFTLVKIVDPKTLWIKTWIDERISGKVKIGQKATITLRSRETMPYEGVVRRIAAVSDPVTQEREVDVGFVKIPEPFYINEQAEVSIKVETFSGLFRIPLRYFVTYQGKKGVWVDQDGKAHFVPLAIVAEDGEFAGVKRGVDTQTKILIPDPKKKPLKEGGRITQ